MKFHLCTPELRLVVLRFAFRVLRFAFCVLCFAFCVLSVAFYILHFAILCIYIINLEVLKKNSANDLALEKFTEKISSAYK